MIPRVIAKLLGVTDEGTGRTSFLTVEGTCTTCDRETSFVAEHEWLRDHFLCTKCGSIPRERALMWCIDTWYPNWRNLRIHESSPGSRGASVKLMKQCTAYVPSQYFADMAPGKVHASGCLNQDLENQTFDDESFDLVVTQDVLEHVFNPAKAFAEIARTLRKGGAHVCTVPLVQKSKASRARAAIGVDGITHMFEPQYHGNPIDPSGSLVTWDWGYDIVDFIYRSSGLVTTIVFLDRLDLGIRAEYIEVLVSTKATAG